MAAQRTVQWGEAIGQGYILSQYTFVQYREADYPAARAALRVYMDHLDAVRPASGDWQPGESPLLTARGLAFEKLLTVGRLALLEERRGATGEAAALWAQAEGYARAAGWRDRSPAHLRSVIQRLDAFWDRDPEAGRTPKS